MEEYNGTVLFTGKTEYKYDEQGREIYEVYSQYLDNGCKKKVDMEDTWSTLENGQTQFMQKTYFYSDDNDTDKYMTGELIKKYNANGDIVYAFEKKIEDGKDSYKYEEEYSYDTDKYLLSSTFWLFDENNAKLADIHEEIVYDDNHNIIDSKYSNGQGTGENDWINISRYTYAYENNVRTEKLAYRWENGDWVTNWGNGVDFDYQYRYPNFSLLLVMEMIIRYLLLMIIQVQKLVGILIHILIITLTKRLFQASILLKIKRSQFIPIL